MVWLFLSLFAHFNCQFFSLSLKILSKSKETNTVNKRMIKKSNREKKQRVINVLYDIHISTSNLVRQSQWICKVQNSSILNLILNVGGIFEFLYQRSKMSKRYETKKNLRYFGITPIEFAQWQWLFYSRKTGTKWKYLWFR